MKSLDLYIFRQLWTPFVFATTAVTGVVWLTQSLQRLDLLVDHGQALLWFARVTSLLLPSLIAAVLPFSLFAATLFALHRMHSDSEIAVMFSAGVGRFRLAAPMLAVTLGVAIATSWFSLDLMPRSYRVLKQEIAEVRADFASAVLRSGEFIAVVEGFTVYVETAEPNGQFSGLLVHDYRKGDQSETYMAQRGMLRETGIGPVLYLSNGNFQRVDPETGRVEIVEFEQTAVNLREVDRGTQDLQLEMTERYLGELLRPDLTRAYDRDNRTRLIAEGHSRLAAPLYAFAYVLIALYALLGGGYDRRAYFVRIIAACACVGAVRVAGFALQGAAAEREAYWLVWIAPITAISVALLLIAGILRQVRGAPPAKSGG